jgi:HSP20 family protein
MNLIKKPTHSYDVWDPFDLLTDLQTDLNRSFGRSLSKQKDWTNGFNPEIDLQETENDYRIHADLPGMKKEDFDIQVEGNVVTLRGERKDEKEEKKKGKWYSERFYGSFSRSIQLPTEVKLEQIKANYKDGVLDIVLPKSESAKPKQINVEVK